MTVRKYSSRSQQTTLASAITAADATMTVVSGSAVMGGKTLTGSQTYTVVIDPDTSLEEIVDVTLYSSGNTLTITRGLDGSTAQAHSAGAVVRHMVIGRDLQESNDHREASAAVHGLTGTVVGTTDSQTLTNKILTSPTITGTGAIAGTFTGNLTGNVTGNVTGSSGSTTGNAATATALQTGRNFQITGDVEASAVSFNGTGDVTLTTGIATGAIVNADINASAAIDKTKISGTAITAADTGTVTSTMIADGTIVNADINATAAIDKTKISGTAVTQADTGTVTSTMIADGTIVNADVNSSAAIAYSKLNLTGTIVNADISNSAAISLGKLATDPLARANHTGTQTASTISDFDTQVRTSRLDQMAAPGADVSAATYKVTNLGTPTVSTDAATKGYVDTQVNNLIDGAPSTLDTLNEIAAALNDTANFSDTVVLKTGSTMTGALVLNADPSVNLGAATKQYVDAVAGSATAAAASAAAAESAYDSFDDRYLGAKATAPTLDNDGNALLTGALYFDTVANKMYVYNGSAWQEQVGTVSITRWKKTMSGGETSLSGTDDNAVTLAYTAGYEKLFLNGVLLVRGDDYTATNGTSITGLTALTASDVVEIFAYSQFQVSNAIPLSTVDQKGDLLVASAADTVGRLASGTDGYILTADSSQTFGMKWSEGVTSLDLTLNNQTAAYTFVLSDKNKLITVTSASNLTITIPTNVSVAFPIGSQIHLSRFDTGTVTISGDTGVTVNSTGATATAPTLRAQYSSATCIKTNTDTWLVIGDIA